MCPLVFTLRWGVIAALSLFGALAATADAAADSNNFNKSPPGTLVVDSRGSVLGNLNGANCVDRRVTDKWVGFCSFETQGFTGFNSSTQIPFLYMSSDCTDQQYLDAENVPVNGWLVSGPNPASSATLYYPGTLVLTEVGSENNNGTCLMFGSPFHTYVGPAESVTLNFVPPFSVQ
jgi:hypothetical protein